VSSWESWRRGSAASPTRDGSSPVSSFANVRHSDLVSMMRSPKTRPASVSNGHGEGGKDTTIVTDHVTSGEIFYKRRVTAFGTDQIDLQVRTEGFRDLWSSIPRLEGHFASTPTNLVY
jgi:hypothetical protein